MFYKDNPLTTHGYFHFPSSPAQTTVNWIQRGQNSILSTSNSHYHHITFLEKMAVDITWKSNCSNLTCFHTGFQAIFFESAVVGNRVAVPHRWLPIYFSAGKIFIWLLLLNGCQYALGHLHLSVTQHERREPWCWRCSNEEKKRRYRFLWYKLGKHNEKMQEVTERGNWGANNLKKIGSLCYNAAGHFIKNEREALKREASAIWF